jgi:hypothetical protein
VDGDAAVLRLTRDERETVARHGGQVARDARVPGRSAQVET